MPKFGHKSKANLKEVDKRLQKVLKEVIKIVDFSILEGHRNQATQDRYYKEGFSKKQYPHSKHNVYPSLAVDIMPWPTAFKDKRQFYYIAGVMFTIAKQQGVNLRWGGDWDGDRDFSDQTFDDLGHFELNE